MELIKQLENKLRNEYHKFLVDHYPRKIIDRIWWCQYGHIVNWDNPKDINEKIQWLICYGDTSKWSDLADKYKVREYVKEKGYEHILTKLYGVWNRPSDIDFNSLPNKFILKCNHDCGSYLIIDKSDGYNRKEICKNIDTALNRKFGYINCEPHYNKISPKVVAEEFLENTESFSTSLIDYKVWCFNGKPYCIFVAYNRTQDHLYTNVYDMNWKVHPEWSVFTNHYLDGNSKVTRPEVLDEMLEIASNLSVGFPEVRIDFYIVKNKIYFGEMTFTSACGRMDYFSQEYLEELGRQCDISNNKKKHRLLYRFLVSVLNFRK